MRLKTFHDKTMAAVMQKVRESMGPDAIIISVDEGPEVAGVRVTAALEGNATPPAPKTPPEPNPSPPEFEVSRPTPIVRDYDRAELQAVINHHGVPPEQADPLFTSIDNIEAATLVDALAGGLETTLSFSPLTDVATRPIMLVGPPGAGKTVCSAKLAAGAVLHRRKVRLISTDTIKAGGVAQLDHFAQIMRLNVMTAETPEELGAVLKSKSDADLTLIDTSGVNPFDVEDLSQLLKFVKKADAEPVLVMPSGLNPHDSQEIARVFQKMGGQRFIATRLDASRRYGSLLSAARKGNLSLAAYSRSPFIAEGLESASAIGLARLLSALPPSPSSRGAIAAQ